MQARSDVAGERLFTFAIIADTHVTEEEAAAIGGYDIDTVRLGAGRSRYVVHEINRLKPDFVIHLGDITHPEPGTPAYEDSANRFHRVHDELDCPLYLVPGNHDIGEKAFPGEPLPDQHAQHTVNEAMIAEYEKHFQAQYFSFEHEDCLFIAINGMIVNSALACEAEQRAWLEGLLEANRGRRIFVFSHYPAYLSDPAETEHYDATDEPGRSWLVCLLDRYGVEAFFSGHVHNFFFNRCGDTHCYVLPSTCFLRHDYHELFKVAPGMKQGRHDAAKLGYGLVEVHASGHLHHTIRSHGRTLEPDAELPPATHVLPRVHGLAPDRRGVGLYLRQPWCDSADIPTPWGLDAFRRKRIRNDYPLLALWEMGVRDLRVPLDDLADPATRSRMVDLASLGHRFTAYSYGLPKGAARQVLVDHGAVLAAWEVIAPSTSLAGLLPGLAELRGETPVLFNASRVFAESFSSSHGLQAEERGAVEALLALDGARNVIDGMVFGAARDESPARVVEVARRSVEGLGVTATVHVQFAHRKLLDEAETAWTDANRVAEAVVAALAHDDVTMMLDNFTGIDRGYYFSGGLVDRVYNPLDGARIVRHLHAALGEGCAITAIQDGAAARVIMMAGSSGEAALVLPAAGHERAMAAEDLSGLRGRCIDLRSGDETSEVAAGPALVLTEPD
mgnify:FL=1